MKDNSITTFIAGAAIGAVLGVLFAPDRGEETRRRVKAAARDGRDFVRDTCTSVSERAEAARSDIAELRGLLSDEGQALKDSVREKLYARLDRLEKAFDEQMGEDETEEDYDSSEEGDAGTSDEPSDSRNIDIA